jgi:hypothetical protein
MGTSAEHRQLAPRSPGANLPSDSRHPRAAQPVAYVDLNLNRVVAPLELRFRLSRTPLKIRDILAALVHPLVAPFEDLIHQSFEA